MSIVNKIKGYFAKNTIWGKYLRMIIPAVAILIVVMDLLVYIVIRQGNTKTTDIMARQAVTMQVQSLRNEFSAYLAELHFLQKEYRLGEDPMEFLRTCQAKLSGSPMEYKYISLGYPQNGNCFNTMVGKDTMDFRTTKAYQKIYKNKLNSYITLPQDIGLDLFDVAIPITAKGDSICAVLSIGFASTKIDKALASIKANGHGYMSIANTEFLFRTYYDNDVIITTSLEEMMQKGFKGIDTILAYDLNHRDEACVVGEYFTNHGISITTYTAIVPNTEVGISLNVPTFLLNSTTIYTSIILIVTGILVIVLLVLVVRKITSRIVLEPLGKVSQFTQDFSEGLLFSEAAKNIVSDDEFGTLKNNIQKMQEQIVETIRSLRKSSNTIYDGSKPFNERIMKMLEDVQSQSVAVEEISTSIEKITASIQQNANNAEDTKNSTDAIAEEMAMINMASDNTQLCIQTVIDKMQVINEITSRTDLLAINAAVEAARAGEHGQGFAVVAAEIRKLAERCQEASTDINESSSWSLTTTNQVVELVQEVTPKIQSAAEKITEISDVCAEQLNMTISISRAILQLVDITANNTQSADLMNEYCDALRQSASELYVAIDFFKLNDKEAMSRQNIVDLIQNHSKKILDLKAKLMSLSNDEITAEQEEELSDIVYENHEELLEFMSKEAKEKEIAKRQQAQSAEQWQKIPDMPISEPPAESEQHDHGHQDVSLTRNSGEPESQPSETHEHSAKPSRGADINLDSDFTPY